VAALFDPAASRADLISIQQQPGEDAIELRWRLEGKLNFFGGLPIKPYTGAWRPETLGGGAAAGRFRFAGNALFVVVCVA